MKWRYAPYIVILAFSIVITVFRFFMIPEWSVVIQILLFFLQFLLLVGIWGMINLLGNYFDKHVPFNSNPARRMILQIASSIVIVVPVMMGISTIVRPYSFLVSLHTVNAQKANSIFIEECYRLAKQNYPLVKQQDLIAKTKEYSIANNSTAWLPQFTVYGQATYQSAVTEIPIKLPNIG